jgi:hypothetical protein
VSAESSEGGTVPVTKKAGQQYRRCRAQAESEQHEHALADVSRASGKGQHGVDERAGEQAADRAEAEGRCWAAIPNQHRDHASERSLDPNCPGWGCGYPAVESDGPEDHQSAGHDGEGAWHEHDLGHPARARLGSARLGDQYAAEKCGESGEQDVAADTSGGSGPSPSVQKRKSRMSSVNLYRSSAWRELVARDA